MIKLGKETIKKIEMYLDMSDYIDIIIRRHENKLTIDTHDKQRRYIGKIYKK